MLVYESPTKAGTGLLPGTALLRQEINAALGLAQVGGYNRRCVRQCGAPVAVGAGTCSNGHQISNHAVSNALDFMTDDPVMHHRIVEWCHGPRGQAWQVWEIVTGFSPPSCPIAGPVRWTAGTGWRAYNGVSAHRDHVHISHSLTAAAWVMPPAPQPQEDTTMFRLIRPAGFYDIGCLGGVAFHALDPDVVNDLVDHNLVVGLSPGARNYDAAATVLLPKTWKQIVGKAPAFPRPDGEV